MSNSGDRTDLYSVIEECFDIKEADIRTYSPLALAFIGDCVFDIVIRSIVVGEGNSSPGKLHKRKADIVKASSQALFADLIADILTDEEKDAYRRGRNAHTNSKAKNSSDYDYHKATGFEALLGYLYMDHRQDRIMEIIRYALNKSEGRDQ